jgi:hypothetical protein
MLIFLAIAAGLALLGALAASNGFDSRPGFVDPRRPERGDLA